MDSAETSKGGGAWVEIASRIRRTLRFGKIIRFDVPVLVVVEIATEQSACKQLGDEFEKA